MFKTIVPTTILQPSIRALSAFIDEAVLSIDADEITSRAVDPANAGMTSINIPSTECGAFEATDCELGIDLTRFTEIIGMANKNNDIALELDEDAHKLCVSFDGFAYTMGLLDPTSMRKSPTVPQLDLPAKVTIETTTFGRMIKAASMTSDHMRMGVQGETFFMAAKGDSDEVRLDLAENELISLKSADVSSLYSLEYLADIGKGIGSASEVVIHLGRDLPVVIDFESSVDCPVEYVLAPRIESN